MEILANFRCEEKGGGGGEEGEASTVFVYFSSRTEQPVDKQQCP